MTRKYWIGVASRDHVKMGVAGGFCQLCHGKAAPVRRLKPGDGLIYYSPRENMQSDAVVQSFTAIGVICAGAPYAVEQKPGFIPLRRRVDYADAIDAPIRPLLESLDFVKQAPAWGLVFRRGVFPIGHDDFACIARAMHATALLGTDPEPAPQATQTRLI